jgi:hypothetical protein
MLKSSRKSLARLAQRKVVSALSALNATKLLLLPAYVSETKVQKFYDSDDREVLTTFANEYLRRRMLEEEKFRLTNPTPHSSCPSLFYLKTEK